ncbi:uncharacterized protein LOC109820402 [Asparagus officinalis]|uniref:uncharacterized protein LOC109820402 n=1 Tax=Asparagus officinalis TaxID=4686 RepID=UPI00098DF432|nr:uncharacterized protein LOC109820402 [Asparagus officinalis]
MGIMRLGAIVLVIVSMLAASEAATSILVGGSQHWKFGFNYSDWALKTAPFYENDKLVFMYDPPNSTTHAHSVYLLKSLRAFLACDFKKAQMVGNVTDGGGQGFEFVLKKRKPHYFACAERGGLHCTLGLMKFIVTPVKPCTCRG